MSTYTPSKPCKKCKTSARYVSNKRCVECVRLTQKRYKRKPLTPEQIERKRVVTAEWGQKNAEYLKVANRARYELRIVEQTERREFIARVINTYGFAEFCHSISIDPVDAKKYLKKTIYIKEAVMDQFMMILANLGHVICRSAS